MMGKKTNAMLEEENAQLEAELSAALDSLEDLKAKIDGELDELKAKLSAQAEANEKLREQELAVATAGYEALYHNATAIYETQEALDPKTIGIGATCAREGILSVLKEIFGEL